VLSIAIIRSLFLLEDVMLIDIKDRFLDLPEFEGAFLSIF